MPTNELSYTELEQQLKQAPLTWLPGLLYTLVTECVRRRVFQDGGLIRAVTRAQQTAEDEDARIINTPGAGAADQRGDGD